MRLSFFSRTRISMLWSKRIRTFACRYQKPMPYHLAILQTVGSWGEGEGRSRARRKRAVQGRGDIASKLQGFPFRTDYNKLAILIETKGQLSALFACNALPIKVGERFHPLLPLLRNTPTKNLGSVAPCIPRRPFRAVRSILFPDPKNPITYLYEWDGW